MENKPSQAQQQLYSFTGKGSDSPLDTGYQIIGGHHCHFGAGGNGGAGDVGDDDDIGQAIPSPN